MDQGHPDPLGVLRPVWVSSGRVGVLAQFPRPELGLGDGCLPGFLHGSSELRKSIEPVLG